MAHHTVGAGAQIADMDRLVVSLHGAFRVLILWLFNNTGKSVFAAAMFHDTNNVSWRLFPVHGSYYDPRVTSLIVTVAAAIIAAIWGPRALARRRNP